MCAVIGASRRIHMQSYRLIINHYFCYTHSVSICYAGNNREVYRNNANLIAIGVTWSLVLNGSKEIPISTRLQCILIRNLTTDRGHWEERFSELQHNNDIIRYCILTIFSTRIFLWIYSHKLIIVNTKVWMSKLHLSYWLQIFSERFFWGYVGGEFDSLSIYIPVDI